MPISASPPASSHNPRAPGGPFQRRLRQLYWFPRETRSSDRPNRRLGRSDERVFRSGVALDRNPSRKATIEVRRRRHDVRQSPHRHGLRRRRTSSLRPPRATGHHHNLPSDHPGSCEGARARGLLTRSQFPARGAKSQFCGRRSPCPPTPPRSPGECFRPPPRLPLVESH